MGLANPWVILGLLLALAGSVFGGYQWGASSERDACAAAAGGQAAKAEGIEDGRDASVDAIGSATSAAVNAAGNQTREAAHESAERVRTVVVPGPCRVVDPVVVRETRAAVERINAKVRGGLRPGAGTVDPAGPDD